MKDENMTKTRYILVYVEDETLVITYQTNDQLADDAKLIVARRQDMNSGHAKVLDGLKDLPQDNDFGDLLTETFKLGMRTQAKATDTDLADAKEILRNY